MRWAFSKAATDARDEVERLEAVPALGEPGTPCGRPPRTRQFLAHVPRARVRIHRGADEPGLGLETGQSQPAEGADRSGKPGAAFLEPTAHPVHEGAVVVDPGASGPLAEHTRARFGGVEARQTFVRATDLHERHGVPQADFDFVDAKTEAFVLVDPGVEECDDPIGALRQPLDARTDQGGLGDERAFAGALGRGRRVGEDAQRFFGPPDPEQRVAQQQPTVGQRDRAVLLHPRGFARPVERDGLVCAIEVDEDVRPVEAGNGEADLDTQRRARTLGRAIVRERLVSTPGAQRQVPEVDVETCHA